MHMWHQYAALSKEITRRFRFKNQDLMIQTWRVWRAYVKSCQVARAHASASRIAATCRGWICRRRMLPPHILPLDLTPSAERDILRRRRILRWRKKEGVALTFHSTMSRLTTDSVLKNRVRVSQCRIVNLSPCVSIGSKDLNTMLETPTHSLHAHSVPLTPEDGITIARSILRPCVNLKALSFDRCEFGNRGAVAMLDALMERHERKEAESEIHTLAISDSLVGHRTVCAIARAVRCGVLSNLTSLNLDGIRSRERSASSMSRILRSGSLRYLKMFSMTRASIGDLGGCRIAQSLSGTPTLRHLDLSGNNLTESTARALVKALEYSGCRISSLVLSSNHLGNDGTVTIARALPRFECLEHLDLSSNNIGNAGISALSRGLRMDSTLRVLLLSRNVLINDVGLKQLLDTVRDSHERKIVGACSLTEIDVSGCPNVSSNVQSKLIELLTERVGKSTSTVRRTDSGRFINN